jgi:nitronate monooxygenase
MELTTTRRSFLGTAAATFASTMERHVIEQKTFRTPLCDLLGIEFPVIQAPMQTIASPKLVASVCEAGGMGILAGIGVPPDDLRNRIREVRTLTKRPFGVNLVLHSALLKPIEPGEIPPETVRGAQTMLNRFRQRLGLPPQTEPPPRVPDTLMASFDVIVSQRVPLFSTGLGLPSPEMMSACRKQDIKVMCMVARTPDAIEAEKLGATVIAAQGVEAGGHRSLGVKPETPESAAIGTMALVAQITRAVKVPVVAAGGISDGRGLAAALMLGAVGVLMGTRFIATTESAAPAFHKKALVDGDSDQTTLSDAFTGHYARFLRNDYTTQYREAAAPVLPPVVQQLASRDIIEAALRQEVSALYPLYAGQGVGMIDTIPSAGQIVRDVIAEARQALSSVQQRVTLDR